MRSPYSPLHLLLFGFAAGLVLALVQVGMLTVAFEKLGLTPTSAMLLLFMSLFGSTVNLPLFTIASEKSPWDMPWSRLLLRLPEMPFSGKTLVGINVGGGVIPVFFSLYLLRHNPLPFLEVVLATAMVAAVCHLVSRPIPRIGIGIPIFIPPLVAALTATVINPEASAPLAYICGTLGVLIGADLMRLKDIRKIGAPVASIGGAGTFDGIFITGVVAVLLA
jgi:Predicted membrane protein